MRSLSRRWFLGAATLCLAGPARAATQPAKPKPVVGAALPLTGDLSLVGDECWRGIQLAADAVNAAAGVAGAPVALVSADTAGQNQAGAAVNGLIGAQHSGLILGAGSSAFSYGASAAAELAQIPYIELDAPADGITARGFKFLLRIGPTTAMIAAVAASAIQARAAGQKIGFLFNTGATGGAIAAAALAALNAAKLPPYLAIGYPEDETDLYNTAGRLKRAGVTLLLHAAGPLDVLGLFEAMAEQDWRPQTLIGCGDGYALRESAAAIGPAFDGTLAIAAPGYRAAPAIADAYMARYGMKPRAPDSLTAYAGARLVLATLNQEGGDAAKCFAALGQMNLPRGALANGFGVAFDHTGQNTGSFVTLQRWRGQELMPEPA